MPSARLRGFANRLLNFLEVLVTAAGVGMCLALHHLAGCLVSHPGARMPRPAHVGQEKRIKVDQQRWGYPSLRQ
jgi:hypothetical protein